MRYGFFTLVCFLGLVLPILGQSSDHTELFRTTVIAEVSFQRAPLDEVITFLQKETRQEDRQVNFVIPPETKASERVVTLDLRNAKAIDVFATVLRMTGTRAELRRGMVWILPAID